MKEEQNKSSLERKSKQQGKGQEVKATMRADALAREEERKEKQRLQEEKTRRALATRRMSARLKRKQDKEYQARKKQKVLKSKPPLVPIILNFRQKPHTGRHISF